MVQFTINRDLDPDGTSLRRLLEAQFRYERMSAARFLCVHLLAIVGAMVWLGAIWPSLLPAEVLLFALTLWGAFLFLTVWVSVEEWVWHRRMERYLSQHQAGQSGAALDRPNKL